MKIPRQARADPGFLQTPYPFYARARAAGPLPHRVDHACTAAFGHAAVRALLRDRRLGREMRRGDRLALRPGAPPNYAGTYHFHGLARLMARAG
ncbi:MAG: hypothetical protein AB7S99_10570 [Pseudodonghicola sp.]